MTMIKHISIKIYGLVQGVFFRAATQERAWELNLAGFVRNEPDGSVYAEAEGDAQAVDAFIAWCRQGPERARVDNCVVVEGQPKGYTDFVIKR